MARSTRRSLVTNLMTISKNMLRKYDEYLGNFNSWPLPHKGEIWSAMLLNFFADPHMPRPVLILSTANHNKDSVLVAPLTSFSKRKSLSIPGKVFIEASPESGLRNDTVASCDKACSIHRCLLHKGPFGMPLNNQVMDEVEEELFRVLTRQIGKYQGREDEPADAYAYANANLETPPSRDSSGT